MDLNFHQRRVGIVMWHPSAQNILLSCGSDNNVCVWNVGTGECLVNFALPELVLSASFNWDGSEVIFTCKDKKIRRVRLLKEKLEQFGLTVNIHQGRPPHWQCGGGGAGARGEQGGEGNLPQEWPGNDYAMCLDKSITIV